MAGFRTSAAARAASYKRWAQTVDRTAATRKATAASPVCVDYHLARLGPEFDSASNEQRLAAAEAARKAHINSIVAKSVEARRAKRGAA